MINRRSWLQATSAGFGYLAFAALAQADAAHASQESVASLAPKETHFAARAKRVLFLCMEGAPSHVDTFDYKPVLSERDSQASPSGIGGRGSKLMGSPFRFEQHGESGIWMSELFPELAKHADKLCMLNGMHTDLPNHAQAFLQMHTGIFQFPRPSMGAWVLYGLGTENQNLPGFITINPPRGVGGAANYASSFLPPVYQGTRIGSGTGSAPTVSNLQNSRRSLDAQRIQLEFSQQLNRATAESLGDVSQVEGLISSYELAFRMQSEMPDVLDTSNESEQTLRLYGIESSSRESAPGRSSRSMGAGSGDASSFGRQCLVARRLLEAGVRFVEVTMPGWDHHRDIQQSLSSSCASIDRPIAGLLADLESRGMLSDTLVLWGGEFGRSPFAQGDGRDHNNKGFTMWMAGAGVRNGFVHGQTDEFGYQAISGKVHMHDWHATILHLLGLDHERLTYRYAGREMRLTDVKGTVVQEIVAG